MTVTRPDLAWLFPGQGSQAVGMGKALAEWSTRARAVYAAADDALGFALSVLCFEGPEDRLTQTENAQPAIVTTSIALLEALREVYPELPSPAYAAGHSLGEYSALVAAGALDLADAVRIVRERGRAMQVAVPAGEGGMAAVMGASDEQIVQLCIEASAGEVLSPANFNAPGQVVIAGAQSAVDRAVELAKTLKLKAIPLKVSAPFHCSLMAPAGASVARSLSGVALANPAFPVVANVDAQPNRSKDRIADLLVRQVDSPVRWQASIQTIADAGVTHALELGPGKVLAGLVKRIDKRVSVLSVNDQESVEKTAQFLAS